MATQQRQYGLISDEYGFLVGSRRLEQGIESVDDKVQRIIDLLENFGSQDFLRCFEIIKRPINHLLTFLRWVVFKLLF